MPIQIPKFVKGTLIPFFFEGTDDEADVCGNRGRTTPVVLSASEKMRSLALVVILALTSYPLAAANVNHTRDLPGCHFN